MMRRIVESQQNMRSSRLLCRRSNMFWLGGMIPRDKSSDLPASRLPLVLAVLFVGMLAGSVRGESVTGKNSHNGVSLSGEVRAALESAAGGTSSMRSDTALAHPAAGSSAEVADMVSVGTAPPFLVELGASIVPEPSTFVPMVFTLLATAFAISRDRQAARM